MKCIESTYCFQWKVSTQIATVHCQSSWEIRIAYKIFSEKIFLSHQHPRFLGRLFDYSIFHYSLWNIGLSYIEKTRHTELEQSGNCWCQKKIHIFLALAELLKNCPGILSNSLQVLKEKWYFIACTSDTVKFWWLIFSVMFASEISNSRTFFRRKHHRKMKLLVVQFVRFTGF